MKVLIVGGNGMLGPWAVKAMKKKHDLMLTDINEPPKSYDGEYKKLSVDDVDGLVKLSSGVDVIVNLSVLREDRKLAFDVNTIGNYSIPIIIRNAALFCPSCSYTYLSIN